jgi:hypothetical protein
MMLNTRAKSQMKTKVETLAVHRALSKARTRRERTLRARHAGGIRALSTVAVDKVVNSVSAHALSGLQIRRFLSVMKM